MLKTGYLAETVLKYPSATLIVIAGTAIVVFAFARDEKYLHINKKKIKLIIIITKRKNYHHLLHGLKFYLEVIIRNLIIIIIIIMRIKNQREEEYERFKEKYLKSEKFESKKAKEELQQLLFEENGEGPLSTSLKGDIIDLLDKLQKEIEHEKKMKKETVNVEARLRLEAEDTTRLMRKRVEEIEQKYEQDTKSLQEALTKEQKKSEQLQKELTKLKQHQNTSNNNNKINNKYNNKKVKEEQKFEEESEEIFGDSKNSPQAENINDHNNGYGNFPVVEHQTQKRVWTII